MSSEAPSSQEKKNVGLGEGLLLASLPIVGYWLAYLFELGYCHFFKLPSSYIKLDLTNIFSGMLGALSIFVIFWFFLEAIFQLIWRNLRPALLSSVMKIISATFVVLLFSLAFSWSIKQTLVVLLIGVGFLAFLEFVFPLLSQKGVKGYLAKLDAEHTDDIQTHTLLDRALSVFNRRTGLGILLLYPISIFAWGAGAVSAFKEQTFWVFDDAEPRVVLRHYGDKLLTRQYCESAMYMPEAVTIVTVTDRNQVVLRSRKLGPLRVGKSDEAGEQERCDVVATE